MSDDQSGGNSSSAVAEPVSGQAAPASSGTSDQNGQAVTQDQSAPAEESFSSIDPKTLPPELQAVYKSMQSDYTKKLQPIAEMRKKAEAYDTVSKDQRFVDYWKGLNREQKADYKEQKAEAEKRLGEKISDDEFTKAFNSKDEFLSFFERAVREVGEKSQKKIEKLEQQLSVKDSQDLAASFATETGKDGKLIRPDFDDLEENKLISGYLSINKPENESPEAQLAKLHEAYSWAKTLSQKYYEKGKAEALQVIQKKAASSTEPPTQAAKGQSPMGDPKKWTAREAMDYAKKGGKIPQFYD